MKIKKLIYVILALLLLVLIGGYFYVNWAFNQPCPPPEKPSVVPERAVWKGGCDGGHWVEFLEKKGSDRFRFKVYRDWDGLLTLDAEFKFKDCAGVQISEENWAEYVTWFSGENLEIKNSLQSKDWNCRLIPIYPAYGGDQWEIKKEKKDRE